jgi:hypothetical protein
LLAPGLEPWIFSFCVSIAQWREKNQERLRIALLFCWVTLPSESVAIEKICEVLNKVATVDISSILILHYNIIYKVTTTIQMPVMASELAGTAM